LPLSNLRYAGNHCNHESRGSVANIKQLVLSSNYLKELYVTLDVDELGKLSSPTLETIIVTAPLDIAMPYLEKMTKLADVDMMWGAQSGQGDGASQLQWRRLWNSNELSIPFNLLERTVENLVELGINVTPRLMCVFLSLLHKWQRLEDLRISIYDGPEGRYEPGTPIQSNYSVRRLHITRETDNVFSEHAFLWHRAVPNLVILDSTTSKS
ncbi:hypothetical protein PIIN_09775, partial [Serendipita indica DSM 11827]